MLYHGCRYERPRMLCSGAVARLHLSACRPNVVTLGATTAGAATAVSLPPVTGIVSVTSDPLLPEQDWAPDPFGGPQQQWRQSPQPPLQEVHRRQYHYTDNRSGQGYHSLVILLQLVHGWSSALIGAVCLLCNTSVQLSDAASGTFIHASSGAPTYPSSSATTVSVLDTMV
jgi:hypothetical protein